MAPGTAPPLGGDKRGCPWSAGQPHPGAARREHTGLPSGGAVRHPPERPAVRR
ncbi:hypothetical protein ACSCBZ_38045 [Streptomyces niveiscabiei]|uniref:hypothetical protein n=1 Tax=Streptomyces TaxID=1883 RepID=UPI00131D4960|nr:MULTISPECIES: hypothetical protein [Streptomyces]